MVETLSSGTDTFSLNSSDDESSDAPLLDISTLLHEDTNDVPNNHTTLHNGPPLLDLFPPDMELTELEETPDDDYLGLDELAFEEPLEDDVDHDEPSPIVEESKINELWSLVL